MAALTPQTYLAAVVAAYFLSAGVGVYITQYALRHGDRRVSLPFGVGTGALSVWAIGNALRVLASSPDLWYVATAIAYVGIVTAPIAFLVFALRYAGYGISHRGIAVLSLPAVALYLIVVTDPIHGLYYGGLGRAPLGPIEVYEAARGPLFWTTVAESYLPLAVGSVLILYNAAETAEMYRRESLLLITGILIPWVINALHLAGAIPLPVDPAPIAFTVGLSLIAMVVFRSHLVDIVPVARDRVVEAITDPVVVVDDADRIVDCNAAARVLFDDDPIGLPIETALPSPLVEAGDEPTRIELDDGVRWLRPDEMPLEDGSRVILFSDLTEERRANERFAEQNRRLEEFAAVAAHDLRNPLNILEGYIDLAREEEEVSYLAETDEPLERARLVVQDLLALGRNMDIVTEPEPVEFDPLVESVIERVAGEETLEHDPVGTVVASPSRLERLLENLIENAHDHGGDRIEIGPRPGGFYVADNGSGIPEADREAVFEYDYSTHREGPGLGLPLVASIAAAHGWEATVHEREDGGARVEVTGVEMPQTRLTRAN